MRCRIELSTWRRCLEWRQRAGAGSKALALLALAASVQAQISPPSPAPQVRPSPPIASLNGFVANHGQWPDEVLYFARHRGIEATLLADALVFRPMPDLERPEEPWLAPLVLRLPAAAAVVQGEGLLPTRHHFIRKARSASHVPGFAQVVYRDVAPGIDVVLRTEPQGFAYDLHVAPGADLAAFVLEVEGAESLAIEGGTVLAMQTSVGRVEQQIGAAWEVDGIAGERVPVASAFRMLASAGGAMRFGFEAAGRNPARVFVLDPSLVYATYVGGSGQDHVADAHVDAAGAVYVVARSYADAPTSPNAYQTTATGTLDAWIGKLSPDGSALEWGTFLGGTEVEEPFGIDVDQDGTVVVAGHTFSGDLVTNDFPTTPGSLQPNFGGLNNDLFVARLTPDGSDLVWSTYYGGSNSEIAQASAMFPNGDVLLAAEPNGPVPPATPGAFDTAHDLNDQMLVRISADGTTLVWQTYFEASSVGDIVINEAGDIYLSGQVFDANVELPTTPGAFKEAMAPSDFIDAYVAKLSGAGDQVIWATYLGGDANGETAAGLALDAAGAVYVAGLTSSADFPVTPGAFEEQPTNNGGDGYVAKLLLGGTGLVWATFISACCGGSTLQSDVAVDTAGNAIAVGDSNEPNYPTTPDAYQPTYIGIFPTADAHLTKFDAFGETLVYSTYIGGANFDGIPGIGLDGSQNPYMICRTGSASFPVTPGAFDTTYGGSTDTAVAKFALQLLPWTVLGGGLEGAKDTPNLAGDGLLAPGSITKLSARGAAPRASTILVAGLSALNAPLKGGLLVPAPDVLLPLTTDGAGSFDLIFGWPTVPAGIELHVQVWIGDAGGPKGYSATNALRLLSQ